MQNKNNVKELHEGSQAWKLIEWFFPDPSHQQE
jgi:hypothetical protein